LSNTEQDWIEKYRAALLASSRTTEPRFRSVVKAIARAVLARFRKIAVRKVPVQHTPAPTNISSGKKPASQRQRKKKKAS
jgi:hypothetical protein